MQMKFTDYLDRVEMGLVAQNARFDGRFDDVARHWAKGTDPDHLVDYYTAPPPPEDGKVQFKLAPLYISARLRRVLIDVLGTDKPAFYRGGFNYYYCTLAQFALFIIRRNESGEANSIKWLEATTNINGRRN